MYLRAVPRFGCITSQDKETTMFVNTLVGSGDRVGIEFDVHARDKYGKLLAYVYFSNGKMLNEELIRAGYANLMTVTPNVNYQEAFLRAFREARENKRGLWRD